MNSNKEEIQLLHASPNNLIIRYQPMIETIVSKYIRNGFFTYNQKNDLIQHVNENLISRTDIIRNQYNGSTLLRTYYSAIIRNLIIEEKRLENKTNSEFRKIENCDGVSYDSNFDKIYFLDEFDRLEKAISMFYRQRRKLILCLKIFFRLPFSFQDFVKYCIKMTKRSYNEIFKYLGPKNQVDDKHICEKIIPVFNKCENKNNSPDALRKWFKHKTDEITKLMNGDPPKASYNKESLQILVEKYFMEYIKGEDMK
jgi:DNA-directed RNA polymerase specialized sigma24 family protein